MHPEPQWQWLTQQRATEAHMQAIADMKAYVTEQAAAKAAAHREDCEDMQSGCTIVRHGTKQSIIHMGRSVDRWPMADVE